MIHYHIERGFYSLPPVSLWIILFHHSFLWHLHLLRFKQAGVSLGALYEN